MRTKNMINFNVLWSVQGSTIMPFPGSENAAGRLSQNSEVVRNNLGTVYSGALYNTKLFMWYN